MALTTRCRHCQYGVAELNQLSAGLISGSSVWDVIVVDMSPFVSTSKTVCVLRVMIRCLAKCTAGVTKAHITPMFSMRVQLSS
jgi:hypothetical protein